MLNLFLVRIKKFTCLLVLLAPSIANNVSHNYSDELPCEENDRLII